MMDPQKHVAALLEQTLTCDSSVEVLEAVRAYILSLNGEEEEESLALATVPSLAALVTTSVVCEGDDMSDLLAFFASVFELARVYTLQAAARSSTSPQTLVKRALALVDSGVRHDRAPSTAPLPPELQKLAAELRTEALE